MLLFVAAFAKLRKATIVFVISLSVFVRLSVRKEERGFHWKDFHEIWNLSIFLKSFEKVEISLKWTSNNGYFK
jgi:hypothetical protein